MRQGSVSKSSKSDEVSALNSKEKKHTHTQYSVFSLDVHEWKFFVSISRKLPLKIYFEVSTGDGFLSAKVFVAKGCVAAFLIAPITAETKEPRFGLGVHSLRLCFELTGLDSALLLLRLYASL